MSAFRKRLFDTLRAVQAVLRVPGTLIVGSEVPNLLQPNAASTLVVSQGVDIAISLGAHARVKEKLGEIKGLRPSAEEPSVWVPVSTDLIEVNFLGKSENVEDLREIRVLEDARLPVMVFGALSLVQSGAVLSIEGLSLPVPRPAGLIIEKLLTDRTGEKGDRDLLVVLGLLDVASAPDISETVSIYKSLPPALRFQVRSSLTTLSLLPGRPGMPDPLPRRRRISDLIRSIEAAEDDLP